MRSPGAKFRTSGPTASTTPASSAPGTKGNGGRTWYCPRTMRMSKKLHPAARTAMRSVPGPGSGSGTSRTASSRGSIQWSTTTARMMEPVLSSGRRGAGDRLAGRSRRARTPHDLIGTQHGQDLAARALAAELAVGAAIPAAAHPLLAVELGPEAVRLGVARLGGCEAAIEGGAAAGHALAVALVRRLEGVELRHEAAHVAQLCQLLGEHLVDAGRTGLGAQRPQALGEQACVIGLALGDDQMAGAEMGVALVLSPGGVELRPPALESTKDVQAFEDVVPAGRFHAPVIAPRAASWKGPASRRAHEVARLDPSQAGEEGTDLASRSLARHRRHERQARQVDERGRRYDRSAVDHVAEPAGMDLDDV